MINRKKIIIYSFIMLGTAFRIWMAVCHFTHIDDVGAVNTIISCLKNAEYDEIAIVKAFARSWTYAPFQALFIQKLVNANMSYAFNIFLGRLPSLVCNVFFIILIYRILCKIISKENDGTILIICIISLSWENIIYSAQAEPYSIGILFASVIVYLLIDKFYNDWKKTVLAAVLFSIACYAQYQMYILVFTVYIISFFVNIKNGKNLIRVIVTGITNLVSSTPMLLFFFTNGRLQEGVNWNVGRGGFLPIRIYLTHLCWTTSNIQ